ncbi:MAG: hypothetical protein H6595_03485 [Flavobacteriales bacterium]|nr:hypothetical protein [Flavobacteriales bacterium]MCB9166521.1 hypothetical protein [Flavobacteriales bacterium]MCB9170276.1 hypothetical protein [Flavobacteriales bacterium]MCB9193759.1 hypothetical protein [Flavobacteriales bacterium]
MSRTDPFAQADMGDFMDSLWADARGYWEAQKDHTLLVASERSAKLAAGLLSNVVLVLAVAIVLLFLSIAGALWIGQALGDTASGFAIMAGAYTLLGAIFLIIWRGGARDRIVLHLLNTMYHDD